MPPVNLKNNISYSIPELNNLNLTLESEYVFMQNEYPNNNFEVFIPTEDTYATLDTSTPPGAYHLLNFASSIGFKSENGGNYKINLRIENLLNKNISKVNLGAVTDVTDQFVLINIKGDKIYDLFETGSPFNFNEFRNKKGSVAQTILTKIDVIIHNLNQNEVNLFVRRSFSQHLFSWMNDSASRL